MKNVKKRLGRILISRYTICAVAIIFEVLILALVIAAASVVSYLFFGIALIVNFAVVVSIINRDANPEYKVTWIIVVMLLPLLGSLLYIIFYRTNLTKREERHLASIFEKIKLMCNGKEPFDVYKFESRLKEEFGKILMTKS